MELSKTLSLSNDVTRDRPAPADDLADAKPRERLRDEGRVEPGLAQGQVLPPGPGLLDNLPLGGAGRGGVGEAVEKGVRSFFF